MEITARSGSDFDGIQQYVYIGNPARASELIDGLQPANFPTTLRRVTEKEFDLLSEHGYQVGRSTLVGLATT
jgi:hypothetical protein